MVYILNLVKQIHWLWLGEKTEKNDEFAAMAADSAAVDWFSIVSEMWWS